MKKKLFGLFALMMLVLPTFVFAGCGTPPPPPPVEPIQFNMTFRLDNAPSADIQIIDAPASKITEGGSATCKIALKNGYRPDGLTSTLNNATITGTLTDEDGQPFSTSTLLSKTIYWTYTVNNIASDTTVVVDVAECQKGRITYTIDPEYYNKLHYAVLTSAPTDTITTQAELTEYLATSQIQTVTGSISVPYGSYVVMISQINNELAMYVEDSESPADDKDFEILQALYDTSKFQYFDYVYQTQKCKVFGFLANDQKLTHFKHIFMSLSDSNNVIPDTFAFCSLTDGTTADQLADGNVLDKHKMLDEEDNPITTQLVDTTYYTLDIKGLNYTYIGNDTLNSDIQKFYSDTYNIWVTDYLILQINGFGSFDAEIDKYYFSTHINTAEPSCTKVDVSQFIQKSTIQGRPAYHLVMQKSDLTDILSQNPEFVVNKNGAKLAFAYLVYEKNQSQTDITKISLQNYNFEEIEPRLSLLGTNAGDSETEYSGYVTYVDYANFDANSKTAPIYYLNNTEILDNSPDNISLGIVSSIGKYENEYFRLNSGFTYTITDKNGSTLATSTVVYTKEQLSAMKNVYCYIPLPSFYNYDHYNISFVYNTLDFDASEHTLSNNTNRDVYYFVTEYSSPESLPSQITNWDNLSSTPPTLTFNTTKILYILADLETTETTEENLILQYKKSSTDAEFQDLGNLVELRDLFDKPVTMTLGGNEYKVYTTCITPWYYPEEMPMYVSIKTTDIPAEE